MYKYYKTKGEELNPKDIFVYLGGIDLYCPIGQHSQLSMEYLKEDCEEITKEEYIKTSGNLYTPKEYIA